MIIDTHSHIFPCKIASKAVANIGKFYDLPMNGGGDIDSLIANGNLAGINYFIVNSSATARAQVEAINNFIIEAIAERTNIKGLCTLHFEMSETEIKNEIKRAKDNNLIGIKLHPDFQHFAIDDKKAYDIYKNAEGELPILFHTGDSRFENSAPKKLAKIAKVFPNLKCIGAHFGGYERWNELECYLETPNVIFDTSSSFFKLGIERTMELIGLFGADRFIFGVDFPMWNHTQELNFFKNLPLTQLEKDKILFKNALNFYDIEFND